MIQPVDDVEGDDTLRAEIIDFLKDKIGKMKQPRSIDFTNDMPRDASGKLYKRKLRDPYWEGHDRAI